MCVDIVNDASVLWGHVRLQGTSPKRGGVCVCVIVYMRDRSNRRGMMMRQGLCIPRGFEERQW